MSKYQPTDLLISRVAWTPDSKQVAYQAQNREQTFLDLNLGGAADGKSTNLFRETTKAWVEVIDNPRWLKDGAFLWLSERNGWKHLYHFAPDGKLLRQLTDGKWEVRSLHGMDEAKSVIYFNATEQSHIAPHVYPAPMENWRASSMRTGARRCGSTSSVKLNCCKSKHATASRWRRC